MARMVLCKKLGRELPALNFQPFDDELGERSERNADAIAPSASFQLLHDRCESFFFGEGSALPPDFKPAAQK